MFFNISREKSGRPGRSGDVMDTVWAAVNLSPPTSPRNVQHIEKHNSSKMYKPECSNLENYQQNDNGGSSRLTWSLGRVARFTVVASSSSSEKFHHQDRWHF